MNGKNRLQEFCQKFALKTPIYEVITIDYSGGHHNPNWVTRVQVTLSMGGSEETYYEEGEGRSKTIAEQKAAERLHEQLKQYREKRIKPAHRLTETTVIPASDPCVEAEKKPRSKPKAEELKMLFERYHQEQERRYKEFKDEVFKILSNLDTV